MIQTLPGATAPPGPAAMEALLAGGPGMGRGRRDPERLRPGDTLDCWRVARIEKDRLLRLQAEMKLPGRGWLEFRVTPDDGSSGSLLRETATFDAHGPFGALYWWVLYPVHRLMFGSILRGLVREAMTARAEGDQVLGPVRASFTPRHDVMDLEEVPASAPRSTAAMAVACQDGRPDGRRDGGVGPA